MKAKQIYLTGILALATVIGVSAHDKGTAAREAASLSKMHEIKLPHTNVEPAVAETIDLSSLNQAVMETQLRELSALLSVKQDDFRMTESVSDYSVYMATTSVEALAKQRQVEAQLASWKSTDAAITEMDR